MKVMVCMDCGAMFAKQRFKGHNCIEPSPTQKLSGTYIGSTLVEETMLTLTELEGHLRRLLEELRK